MKYINYSEEDFIKDEYFQKWVLDADVMSNNFWENWISDHPEKASVVERAKRFILLMGFDDDHLSSEDFDSMWRTIVEKREDGIINMKTRKSLSRNKNWRWQTVAAIFLGLLTTGSAIYLLDPFKSNNISSFSDSQITLELEDGTMKVLEENTSGTLRTAEGHSILTQNQNTLQYAGGHEGTTVLEYNQLTVPYGKKFGIVLSDGTHVFLNSGSKLRYPIQFLKDAQRDVYLDGEAYFSVEKDRGRPFTVITDEMNTKVYGTEFNVSSYKNEGNTSTVLVEGSVGVYKSNNGEGLKPIVIQPGQRAVFEDDKIDVEETDISKYIAWKENKLLFLNDRFDLILKELERHFNVQIENKYPQLNGKKFTGTFEKESLDKILRIFQDHTPFDYKMDGGTIIITDR